MENIINSIKRNWIPLLALNAAILGAAAISFINARNSHQPIWSSSAILNLQKGSGGLQADLGTLGNLRSGDIAINKEFNPLQLQISILMSDTVLDKAMQKDPEFESFSNVQAFKGMFTASPSDKSTVINLGVTSETPELANLRLQNLIDSYQGRLNELRRNHSEFRENFARKDLIKAYQNLQSAQTQLKAFENANQLVDVDAQTRTLIGSINELKARKTELQAQSEAKAVAASLSSARLDMTAEQAMGTLRLAENTEYQILKGRLAEIDTELAELRGTETEQGPTVQLLTSERAELMNAMESQKNLAVPGIDPQSLDSTVGGSNSRDSRLGMIAELVKDREDAEALSRQVSVTNAEIESLSQRLDFISRQKGQLSNLQRNLEIAEGVYKGIVAQVQQSRTDPFSLYPDVQVLDGPSADPSPLPAKHALIILGGLVAALFGSAAYLLYTENSNPIINYKDLRRVELPIVATVERFKGFMLDQNLEANPDFMRMAMAVSARYFDNRRLMITSSGPGEGKTFVSLGLALALVNFGYRILLVDGDIHKSELSRYLGCSNALTPFNDLEDGKEVVSIRPDLDLLPSQAIKKQKSGEFLMQGGFDAFLGDIQEAGDYDYVLVDTAPIPLSVETSLMGVAIKNALFVVRNGVGDRNRVFETLDGLQNDENINLMGLIINDVVSSGNHSYYASTPDDPQLAAEERRLEITKQA